MATIIEMPKLSDTMSEGKILSWKKKEGEAVEAGEVLAEIESDKANMEMEAYDAGYLRKHLVPEGGSAPVGAPIAIVTEGPDEDLTAVLEEARGKTGAGKEAHAPPGEKAAKAEAAKTEGAKAPAKAPAPKTAAQGGAAKPTEPVKSTVKLEEARKPAGGGKPEEAKRAAASRPSGAGSPAGRGNGDGQERVLASPLAYRMAAELGLDLRAIRGSGPEGRIVKRDVEEAALSKKDGGPKAAGEPAAAPFPLPEIEGLPSQEHEDIPLSSMRKIIAQRLSESISTAPHYYVTVEVDMGPAVRAREELNAIEGLEITFNDLVVKAVALGLTLHPELNVSFQGDFVRRYRSVDIGVAVALQEGLVTPVIRACHLKSLGRISREAKALVERARARKLTPDDYQGSTFTVSNLGMFGVKHFTAIINPPEACILAVGGIQDVPVIENGQVVPGRRLALTLSSDHRVVDGASAAQFLREVKRLLEKPMSLAL